MTDRAEIVARLTTRVDWLVDADPLKLRDALEAVLAKAEAWGEAAMPFPALADELLLTVAKPLGARIGLGPLAQLVDRDEERS